LINNESIFGSALLVINVAPKKTGSSKNIPTIECRGPCIEKGRLKSSITKNSMSMRIEPKNSAIGSSLGKTE